MCLVTEQLKPIILEEDLKVYKILKGNFTSVYFPSFQYIPNELNVTQIEDAKDFEVKANPFFDETAAASYGGFLSYDECVELGLKIIGPGFHFFTKIDRAFPESNHDEITISSTIPKGSEVYYDKTGLGVANQIIIHGEAEY